MNEPYMIAENVSKRFLVLRQKATAFRTIKAFIKREPLMKDFHALSDVSFEIQRGEKVAIVGKNGAGKTTLLRIIAGIYGPSSGRIQAAVTTKVLLYLGTGFNHDLSVEDNIYLCGTIFGGERKTLAQQLPRILEMSELSSFIYSPVKRLSLGQIQRLSLSIFLNTPGDFFIFDESLAFVDKGFVRKISEFIHAQISDKKSVIIASHDGEFLKKHCSRAIWLDEGRIRMDGESNRVIAEYENAISERTSD